MDPGNLFQEKVEEPIVCFADVMSEEYIEGMDAQEKEEEERLIKVSKRGEVTEKT